MGQGNYSIVNRRPGEVITAFEYNTQDHQNHITNNTPDGMGGYSDTVGLMQTQTDPGDVGTESLAMTLAQELERLRFVVRRLKGYVNAGTPPTFWYTPLTAPVIATQKAIISRTGTQTIADVTTTPLSFNTQVVNPDGIWLIGAPTQFTAQSDGLYLMGVCIQWEPGGITGGRIVQIRENTGGKVIACINRQVNTGFVGQFAQAVATEWPLNNGESVQFEAIQQSGGARNIDGTSIAGYSMVAYFVKLAGGV